MLVYVFGGGVKQCVPVGALDTSGQRGPDACSGADSNSSLEHRGSVTDASYDLVSQSLLGGEFFPTHRT